MPRVNVTGGQDDLGVGIGFDEFFGESAGGPVANSLTVQVRCCFSTDPSSSTHLAISQKLIPLLTAELANTIILRGKSIVPHQAVRRVLNASSHHVVGLDIAQSLEGLTEGCHSSQSPIPKYSIQNKRTGSSRSSNTKRKDLHGHLAMALPSINGGIIGEDISDRLGSQVIGVN